jgi:hypothetical protein
MLDSGAGARAADDSGDTLPSTGLVQSLPLAAVAPGAACVGSCEIKDVSNCAAVFPSVPEKLRLETSHPGRARRSEPFQSSHSDLQRFKPRMGVPLLRDGCIDFADIMEQDKHEEEHEEESNGNNARSLSATTAVIFCDDPDGSQHVQDSKDIMVIPKLAHTTPDESTYAAAAVATKTDAAVEVITAAEEDCRAITARRVLGTVYEVYLRCALQAPLLLIS